MRYSFQDITHCNMCRESVQSSKILGRRMNRSQGFRPNRKVGISTTVMRCGACGLIYSNPMPVPENIAQHYGIPPESYFKEAYFVVDDLYFDAQIRRFNQLYGRKSAIQALDIGAGVGKCMVAMERHGFSAYGLEPSKPFYDRALNSMRIPPTRLQMASIEDAEYDENKFDFVTFGAVLEHLFDPSKSILDALKWTKPGGLIHIEVPSAKWLTNKISNVVYALQGLDYVANISPMHTPFHLYEFSVKSFARHAELSGYEIAFHKIHVCSTFLPKMLTPVVRPIMSATDTGMQLEIWLRKNA